MSVHEDLDALSLFTVELFNWHSASDNTPAAWADAALFGIGGEVEIWMGYVDDLQKIMVAEITSLEAMYSKSDDEEDVLTVRGYDYRHRLARGRKTRTFSKMKDSAIASQIAASAGLRAQAKDSKVTLPYVVQSNQTDWEFLQSRASRIGYEVFVREKVLYFQPPQNASRATLKLADGYRDLGVYAAPKFAGPGGRGDGARLGCEAEAGDCGQGRRRPGGIV